MIKVENISKKYVIGHQRQQGGYRYRTLRDSLGHTARGVYQRLRHPLSPNKETTDLEEFWALKDISLEIKQGERVGIIGRNGAGKSTLLKILSRITEPTNGRITLNGRVASLLEVGTGFHPELSGCENIYLNGAVLGMTRIEIKKKFDDIVAFAEVEKFLDTPVKHYSSGMYVRLAFAVAAHLEPEILLIDEVLAVGDAEFQKKCLGKMENIAKEGRTILFVSHNMLAVKQLCSMGVFIKAGKVQYMGGVESTIESYLNCESENTSGEVLWGEISAPGNREVKLKAVRIKSDNIITSEPEVDKDISIEIEYLNYIAGARRLISIWLVNMHNIPVLTSVNLKSASRHVDEWCYKPYECGLYRTVCVIPRDLLNPGIFYVNIYINSKGAIDNILRKDHAISFKLKDVPKYREEYLGEWIGVVRPLLEWNTKKID